MHIENVKLGRRPIGYLTNAEGKRTHAIVPLIDCSDDWDDLPSAKPDDVDLAFLARYEKNPDAYLSPAPVKNPIRAARLKAKITQETLACALGISAAALSKQEQESHTPRSRTIDRALAKLTDLKH